MFNLFKKKNNSLPAFEKLQKSEYKDLYFGRIRPWNWLNDEHIYIVEVETLRHVTMDPWYQLIYLAADGNHTLSEFVYKTASMYSRREGIPNELDETILECFTKLVEEMKYLKTSESPFELEINHKLTMKEYEKFKNSN
jgi:hypothetical protein